MRPFKLILMIFVNVSSAVNIFFFFFSNFAADSFLSFKLFETGFYC